MMYMSKKNKVAPHVVQVYYTNLTEVPNLETLHEFLKKMPKDIQQRNRKFKLLEDKKAHLLGRLLLHFGIKKIKGVDGLNLVRYNDYHKPIIPEIDIEFNISHSGKFVTCAFSMKSIIGVDIEEKKRINYNELLTSFNEKEQNIIKNSVDSFSAFYDYWSIREAIIKAEGKGFFALYNNIYFYDNYVIFENNKIYFKTLALHPNYSGYLATYKPITDIISEYITIKEIKSFF